MRCINALVLFWVVSLGAPSTEAAPQKLGSVKPKASSRGSASQVSIPAVLRDVERVYTEAQTLVADFVQENEIASFKQKKTSSGNILIKRPHKVRWETLKPQVNLLVSDGKTYWYYTPPFDEGERGQLITQKTAQVQSQLAQALLSGRFSVTRDMKIQEEGANEFLMTPKTGTAGTVLRAKIRVQDKKIVQVTLEHQGGNRSVIQLSNIRLGEPIRDELFVFIPPPGTDRIREQSP